MMYFHATVEESNVLFKFWQITDVGSMAYSFVIIFLLAFLYEGLKYFRSAKQEGSPTDATSILFMAILLLCSAARIYI